MTIAGHALGYATVTATATDPGDLAAEQTVMVTVEESSMDREILRALFIDMNRGSWDNNKGWLTEAAPDSWYGVTADELDRVTGLELPANRLEDSIPF